MPTNLLLIEDHAGDRSELTEALRQLGWDVYAFATAEECLADDEAIRAASIAVIDYDLGPKMTGFECAKQLQELRGRTSIGLMVYSSHNERRELQAKCDELGIRWRPKSLPTDKLHAELGEMLEQVDSGQGPALAAASSLEELEQEGDYFVSNVSQNLESYITDCIGPSQRPVLIVGETGTGKEGLAQMIHKKSLSPDKQANFRAVNCAAFTDTLLMSELFGHVKGAFTGATNHRIGMIMEAAGARLGSAGNQYIDWLLSGGNNLVLTDSGYVLQSDNDKPTGTLFLDEVADLSPAAQAALLRFLNGDGFHPVGYVGPPLKPRVRIIAATNRSEILYAVGKRADPADKNRVTFRHDLLCRLADWPIPLDPIKQRPSDALSAARRHAYKFGKEELEIGAGEIFGLSQDAEKALVDMIQEGRFCDRDRPLFSGNFRSLLSMINRACWIAKHTGKGRPEHITLDVLKRAMEIDAPWHDWDAAVTIPTAETTAGETLHDVRERLKHRLESWNAENEATMEPDWENRSAQLDSDAQLILALRNLILHGDFVTKLQQLTDDPGENLKVGGLAPDPNQTWRVMATMAILAAVKGKYEFTAIGKITGHKRPQKALSDLLTTIAEPLGLRVRWPGDGQNLSGQTGGFVRAIYEQKILLAADSVADITEAVLQWESEEAQQEKSEQAAAFLDYLARLAKITGIIRPAKKNRD